MSYNSSGDSSVTIWHNPDCSKSRATLALIEARGITPTIVRYLDAPPTAAEISAAAALLGVPVRAMIRTHEEAFARLGLDDAAIADEALAAILSANPALIERPIVFARGRAVIARPPEAARSLL